MGKIRIVLLFDEENEKQRQAGEFLKTQKRCKTALITELIHAWIYNKEAMSVPLCVNLGKLQKNINVRW